MPADFVAVLIQHVRALAGGLPGSEELDRELLQRFTSQNDQTAFATVVLRHGPMVLRVCRRALGNAADAEDVFQATFLVLASRASTERWHDCIANWLFGVAHRLARKTNQAAARRSTHEARALLRSVPDPLTELTGRELLCVLDEELLRVPDRYREPLLLCYLEGLTRDEAALRLGCPLGTLKSRLERGRDLLGRALTRRGIGLSAALAATLAVAEPASAAIPPLILHATLDAVRTGACASLSVGALVEAAAPPALMKGKMALVLLLAGLVMGGFAIAQREKASPDPPPAAAGPAPVREAARPTTDALGDPLPPGALMRLGTRRHRVQGWQSLPDGKSYLILSGSEIRRADSATGKVLDTCPVPGGHYPVGISPDGRHVLLTRPFILYSGLRVPGQKEEQEWALTLYDLATRKAVWTNSEKLEEKNWKRIDSACFSEDGKWIATAGQFNGELRVWDGATGKQLWHRSNAQALQPLGFTDGGNTLVTRARSGNSIYLFNRATGKNLRWFPTLPENEAQQCIVAPDGSAVLFGRYGPTVRVWDVSTGKERAPLAGHKEWARRIAFSRDGKTVATGGNDPFVLVRDWPSGKVTHRIEVRPRAISEMAISGDNQRLEVLYWGEQALHFYDLKTGKAEPALLECHQGNVYGVAFALDGSLLSFGRDASVRTWDLRTRRATGLLAVEQDLNAGGFAVSRDGRLLAVSNSDNKAVSAIERATGKLVRKLPLERQEGKFLTFSADGRWLAGTDRSHEGNIRVWEIATGKVVLQLNDRVTYGVSCSFSADGRQFAASGEGKVRFWEVGSWKEQASLTAYAPLGLAFSPDGRILVTAGVDGVRLFELATHGERAHISPMGNGYPCGIFQFSRSGRWLAWQGSSTHVWDVYSGKPLGSFFGHEGSVTGLAFTADERALATSSADSTILIWDVAGAAAKQPPLKGGDADQAWQALASADAKAADEAMRVMAAAPDTTIRRIARQIKPAASPDGDRLAACLRDLDSVKFEVRVRARRDLEQMESRITAALERFLKGKPSLEVRKRVEEALSSVATEQLRQARVLEVLERIGDNRAQAVLKALARGLPEARLTRDAQSVLERLR